MEALLNTREVSSLFWIALFLCWMLIIKDKDRKIRASFRQLFRALLSKWILATFALMFLWVVGLVLVLESLDLWALENLKLTLYWAIGIAAVALFESKQVREKFSALTMARDHLAAIAIIQVFVSVKPLPLLGEFVLVPIACTLAVLSTFSENKPEFAPAKKLFDVALIVIGVGLLIWSAIGLYNDPIGFSGNLLTNIAIPLMLTIGFTPFLAAFYLFLGHENTVRVLLRLSDTTRFEKIKLILRCFKISGFNLKNISLLEMQVRRHRPKSSPEVVELLDNLSHTFALRTTSYKPSVLEAQNVGWEVKAALNTLVLSGLRPAAYEWLGFVWQAKDCIETTVQESRSILTYYVAGTREVATELELLFEVFGNEADEDLLRDYILAAFSLLEFALGGAFDVSLKNRIKQLKPFTNECGDKIIDFACKEFDSPDGLEVRLTFKVN